MKKNIVVQILLAFAIFLQLIFYHLPEEMKFPLFLLSILLIIIFWIQRKPLLIPKQFTIFFSLYLLANFYSSFYSLYKFQAFLEITKFVGLFFLVILGVNIFRNKKIFLNTLFVLLTIASFWALCGILEFASRVNTQKNLSLFEPFHWPSLASSFFLLIFPYTLVLFLKEKSRGVKKMFLFASLFLVTTAWILSQSYLIILFLVTPVILFLFFFSLKQYEKKEIIKNKAKEIILLVFLIGVTLPNLLPSFGGRYIPKEIALFQEKIFFQDKNDVWRFSAESIKEHFWQGIGLGNFGLAYRQNIIKPWAWSDFSSNELLQTFVETGFFGFIAQLALFLYLFIICFRRMKSSLNDKSLLFFSISLSIISFLVINFNDFSFRIFPILIVFFILVATQFNSEKTIKIKTKSASLLILPIIFIAIWAFSDSMLLRMSQKSLTNKTYQKSEIILNWLSQRPTVFLNPKVLIWQSALELEKGQPQKALEHLKTAKALDPYNQEINYQMAALTYRQGKIEEAKQILEEKLKENPFLPPKYYLSLAKINFETNNNPLALQWLRKASYSFPVANKESFSTNRLSILQNNSYLSSLWDTYSYLYDLTRNKNYLLSLSLLFF